jgi:hypothetical protein
MRVFPTLLLILSGLVLAGCASSKGPTELAIAPADYSAAFDTAIAAARDEGFIATVLDRRAGLIETEPVNASSILEPWHGDNASAAQAWENTLQHQRRSVRFEFAPAREAPAALPPEGELTGANLLGSSDPLRDLTAMNEPLVLRAIVNVERAHTPGERRSAWSRRYVTQFREAPPGEADGLPLSFWEPVGRDLAFEQRLLARIEEMLRPALNEPRP